MRPFARSQLFLRSGSRFNEEGVASGSLLPSDCCSRPLDAGDKGAIRRWLSDASDPLGLLSAGSRAVVAVLAEEGSSEPPGFGGARRLLEDAA